jgi:hypothetical protein
MSFTDILFAIEATILICDVKWQQRKAYLFKSRRIGNRETRKTRCHCPRDNVFWSSRTSPLKALVKGSQSNKYTLNITI